MNTDNKVVQSLWIGKELSALHQTCIQSFINCGHVFHLYVYSPVEHVPEGALIKDANQILPYSRIFTFEQKPYKGKYAPFSDLFRYYLLYLKGGWWVDMDVFCLKYMDIIQPQVVCTTYHSRENTDRPSNFVLKFPKEDPFIADLIVEAEKGINYLTDYVEIGPSLMDRKIQNSENAKGLLVPSFFFSPVSLYHTRQFIVYEHRSWLHKIKEWIRPILKPHSARARSLHPQSYAVHLWNEVWRQNSLDENGRFHPDCLYERLKKQQQITFKKIINKAASNLLANV